MIENENNNVKNHSITNPINIRNQKKTFTNIEYPKISGSKRRSTKKIVNLFKVELKTEEEKEKEENIKNNLFRHATPADVCISALKKNPAQRSEELIKIISFYLQMLKNFMFIFKGQLDSEELTELLNIMASKLDYEHIEKNKFIFKFGDKAEKFYIILKGKVSFCVPKLNKHYLNEEEYIMYLIKLRFYKENDLIKKNLEMNKNIYDLGDNFDQFVLKSITKHEKEDENIYSNTIYLYFYKIKEMIKIEKEKRKKGKDEKEIKYEDIILENYLNRTSIDINSDLEEAKRNKRKLLELYMYEKTNTYEAGDCFGLVGSNNRSHKRSATAITSEDCGLAVLSRDEYNEILNNITKKARERLFSLVSSHKIFYQITKRIFSNKYSHMFRFNRFYFNNIVMDDTQVFNKVILFNSGEFCLFVNKNIIELNELIVKMKKIKGMLFNIPEETVRKDLKEIKENEQYKLNQQYTSREVNEFIMKRQNLIICTVNDNLMLGYPDTCEPDTFMPLFNCKCISTTATGYIVEREMINLFKKDYYLRTTPSEAVLLKIKFYLKRLLEHKKNIMNRMELLETRGKGIKSNYNNNSSTGNNSTDNLNETNPEKNISYNNMYINELSKEENIDEIKSYNETFENDQSISRNNLNPINMKYTNIFEFQKKKIIPTIDKYFSPKKVKKSKKFYYSLDNTITPKNENDNFLVEISNLKKIINKKEHLLRSVQCKSTKFLEKERYENKKIQMKLNKFISKNNYNDLTNIFSKDPTQKKSILDKYLKKSEDNVLDPAIKDINRQMAFDKKLSFLKNSGKTINNSINSKIIQYSHAKNISIDKDNNLRMNKLYKKIKNKLLSLDNEDNNFSNKNNINSFNNNTDINSIKKSLILTPKDLKIRNIKLNYNNLSLDADNIKNNNLELLSNEFYKDYIINRFNKNYNNVITERQNENKKIDNILSNYHKLDNYKINKLKLINIQKEREIKHNYFSPENVLNSVNIQKKGISLVDPLVLDKFNQVYIKERLNTNINN